MATTGKKSPAPKKGFVDNIEEIFIALTLGLMTLFLFANVIVRYSVVFAAKFDINASGLTILWAQEATVFLFAWLVLIGASYGVKHNFHIGIDVVVNLLPPGARKITTLIACALSILFALLLLKGAWDYWSPFIGRQAFYETNDIPNPFILAWLKDVFNDGEAYEKLPRFIPYFALPLGMALLLLRLLQATWRVFAGQQSLIIAAHELDNELDNESEPS